MKLLLSGVIPKVLRRSIRSELVLREAGLAMENLALRQQLDGRGIVNGVNEKNLTFTRGCVMNQTLSTVWSTTIHA